MQSLRDLALWLGLIGAGIMIELGVLAIPSDKLGPVGPIAIIGGWILILAGTGLAIVTMILGASEKRAAEPVFMPVTHLGSGDGKTSAFRTTTPYQLGSLHVFVNGLQQDSIELDPPNGEFELTFTPAATDRIGASWVVGRPSKNRPWSQSAPIPNPQGPVVAVLRMQGAGRKGPARALAPAAIPAAPVTVTNVISKAKHVADALADMEASKRARVERFLALRRDGLALLERLQGLPFEERIERPDFGADDLRGWLARCNEEISAQRAECLLEFDTACQPQASSHTWVVNTKASAAIDLWDERTGQINRVVAMLDGLIRTTK